MIRRLAIAVAALCICGAIVLAALGVRELKERQAGDDYYAALAQVSGGPAAAGTVTDVPDAAPAVGPGASDDGGGDAPAGREASPGAAPTVAAPVDEAPTAAAPTEAEPAATAAPRSAVDFDALRRTCPDVVAWLRIEDTVIDYPVVQGADNDFYLHHLPDGTPNSAGALMLDANCPADFSGQISIIHGHHMRSGSMFGDLDEYGREAYYDAHRRVRLYTPYGDRDVVIIAAYTLDAVSFGYPTSFQTEAELERFIEQAKAASAFDSGVEVAWDDRLVILSTCAYSFENARFVVVGKLEPVR